MIICWIYTPITWQQTNVGQSCSPSFHQSMLTHYELWIWVVTPHPLPPHYLEAAPLWMWSYRKVASLRWKSAAWDPPVAILLLLTCDPDPTFVSAASQIPLASACFNECSLAHLANHPFNGLTVHTSWTCSRVARTAFNGQPVLVLSEN